MAVLPNALRLHRLHKVLAVVRTTPRAFCVKTTKVNIYIYVYIVFFGDLFEIDMFEVFQIFRCSCTGRLPNTSASRNICGNVSTSAGSNAGAYRTGTTSIQVSKAAATSMFRSQGKEWNERN